MKRVGAAAITLSFVFVAAASASPAGGEQIMTTMYFPSLPSAAPYTGTYTGTFSASGQVSDSGTVSVQALLGAVPSPSTGILQTVRTLSGADGTLTLRCNQRIQPGQSGAIATNTGSCVVLDATGAYAGLFGSGHLTGTTNFATAPLTIQDTLTL